VNTAVCGLEFFSDQLIWGWRWHTSYVQLLQLYKSQAVPAGTTSQGTFRRETAQVYHLLTYVQDNSSVAEPCQHSHWSQTSALQGC